MNTKLKKILIIAGGLNYGGRETVIINILKYSKDYKYNFDILVFGKDKMDLEDQATALGARIIHIYSPQKSRILFYWNLNKIMEKYGPYDVVHSNVYLISGICAKVAHKNKIHEIITHIHSTNKKINKNKFLHKYYAFLMRHWIIKYSTKYYAVSYKSGIKIFTEELFKKHGKVLYNQIDENLYRYNKNNNAIIRKELKIPQENIIIGQIARLDDNKNQKLLLNIFLDYMKNNKKINLIIVGEGICHEEIDTLINKNKLNEQVYLLGQRDDIPKLLSSFDVYVCTSFSEGLSLSLLEATANSLPIVISNNAYNNEFDMFDNFYITNQYDNIEEWSKNLLLALNHGRYKKTEIKFSKTPFSINNIHNNINFLYDNENNKE